MLEKSGGRLPGSGINVMRVANLAADLHKLCTPELLLLTRELKLSRHRAVAVLHL